MFGESWIEWILPFEAFQQDENQSALIFPQQNLEEVLFHRVNIYSHLTTTLSFPDKKNQVSHRPAD